MKISRVLVGIAVCFVVHAYALAHGNLACNVGSDFKQTKKIVLYPFADAASPQIFLDTGEGTELFEKNNRLWERMSKKMGKCNILRLSKGIFEEGRVLGNNYSYLMNEYSSEEERAKAISEATLADAYILPRFRENRVRIDHSPETSVNVSLRGWTEEIDSSRGARTYGEYSWTERHVIPAKDIPCQVMDIEYEIRSSNGALIAMYENSDRSYSVNEKDMFDGLVNEFIGDLKDVIKGKYLRKPKQADIKIGFGELKAPASFWKDAVRFHSFLFVAIDEETRLKNAILNSNDNVAKDYIITGTIMNYEMKPEWIPPHTTVVNNCVSSKTNSWRDSKGRMQQIITKQYRQSVEDHHGYYTYTGFVSVDLKLVDTHTGEVVVSYQGENTSEKEIDACRQVMRDFYKKINKYLKAKGKISG